MAAFRRLLSQRTSSAHHPPAEDTLVTLTSPSWRVPVVARSGTSDLAAFRYVSAGAYELELPHPPRLIIDLGANVGFASVDFASRYPGSTVLAVEPHPDNVTLLRRNVRSLSQVDVIEGAAWPHPGQLVLEDPGKGFWGFRVSEPSGEGGAVPAVTIPQLLARAGAESIDLLKVDIEGSEVELFSEDTEWLGHVRVVAIELHDRFRPGCRAAVDAALWRTGATFHEQSRDELTVFSRADVVAR
jgi:FkbM family methyltransferase